MNPLKNLFNQIMWDPRYNRNDFEVDYVHRGVPKDQKTIRASSITTVGGSWFQFGEDEPTTIPFHRILRIRNLKTGRIVWSRKRRVS